MDLIDRLQTLHALCYDCVNRQHCKEQSAWHCRERRVIDNQPAVDEQPVRHGQWVRLVNGFLHCSQCQQTRGNCWGNYCSYCGAKMDGGEDDG